MSERGSKIILVFPVPEELAAAKQAINASVMNSCLSDMANWLRNRTKHGGTEKTGVKEAEACKAMFWEILNEAGIDPWGE